MNPFKGALAASFAWAACAVPAATIRARGPVQRKPLPSMGEGQ